MLSRHEIHPQCGFDFEAGGHLDDLTLVYHCSDRAYSKEEKVVWICHALTGNSDPEDWWADMVGPGRPIDPDKVYVVCVNMICSAYGSSGPASINPETGTPYMMTFPETTVRDMVAANIIIRRHLGIDHIDLLMGPSIGGFQTAEWLVTEPEMFTEALLIATDVRVTPYLTAWEESQRMAIKADPSFERAEDLDGGKAGLECARSIALISYRSYEGYNIRQEEADTDTLFASRAASYQRYQGRKLSDRFDAYSYWYLSRALDSHNIGRGRGGVSAALSSIQARCTVIGIDSDCLFPVTTMRSISEAIPSSEFHEIRSLFGHDGFLLEHEQLSAFLIPCLKRLGIN